MVSKKTQSEKISSEKKSIGFDFQYYFFLWKLLSLKEGESVGLEVKDDVHTELDNDFHIYYQVKHTTQKNADGSPINLRNSDVDLWKTLSNWSKIISDQNDGRMCVDSQLKFLTKTCFVIFSNKSKSDTVEILNCINQHRLSPDFCDKIKECLKTTIEGITDTILQGYINDILDLDDEVLSCFFKNVSFDLSETDIIDKCKSAIISDKVEKRRVDEVFSSIDSAIRLDNFIRINTGDKIQISFDEFYKNFRRYYELSRSQVLPIHILPGDMPDCLESQVFVKQLIEIGDVNFSETDIEIIADYTRHKLKLENNISKWIQDGDATNEEVKQLREDAFVRWQNKHRSEFRNIGADNDCNKSGQNVLDAIREIDLVIQGQELGIGMSNGMFYLLSDVPEIGWRADWEKYKQ